jgi:hypothetical protein
MDTIAIGASLVGVGANERVPSETQHIGFYRAYPKDYDAATHSDLDRR